MSESAADRQDRARDAVQRAAARVVQATANSARPLSQEEAVRRVAKARERGDQIRRESGS